MWSFSYLEPVCCSMSISNCWFLTCIQVSQEAGQLVWYSHLFQNFPQFIVIHVVKDFGIVNKAEIDVFLELSCFFSDLVDAGNLISGSSAFSKTSLNIWKFTVHVLLKPGLENFEHYFTSVWDECNCAVVWAFFGIAFLRDWNENWLFPVLWPLLSFPNLLTYWVQHFHSIIFSIYFSGLSGKESTCQSMQEAWAWSLGQENPLEKEMATYSSILAWKIPWTEEPGGLQCIGLQKSRT